VEYGEKNNSYFLGLEKQRQIKKSINKLIDENNEKITDQMANEPVFNISSLVIIYNFF
jgi:hypothetical protein